MFLCRAWLLSVNTAFNSLCPGLRAVERYVRDWGLLNVMSGTEGCWTAMLAALCSRLRVVARYVRAWGLLHVMSGTEGCCTLSGREGCCTLCPGLRVVEQPFLSTHSARKKPEVWTESGPFTVCRWDDVCLHLLSRRCDVRLRPRTSPPVDSPITCRYRDSSSGEMHATVVTTTTTTTDRSLCAVLCL